MKKTLLTLALLASAVAAQAETLVTMKNDAGGLIQITDDTSKRCDNLTASTGWKWRYMVSNGASGAVIRGCWRLNTDTDQVEVRYGSEGDYETRQYPNKAFTRTPYLNDLMAKGIL